MALEDEEVLRQKNSKRLSCVINLTLTLGVNLSGPSKIKDSLGILIVPHTLMSIMTCYGLVEYVIRHNLNIVIVVESICLLLQVSIAILKHNYVAFYQKQFYRVVRIIETHELIAKVPVINNETQFNKQLRKDVLHTLDNTWASAIRLFNMYTFCVSSIIGYYFFGAVTINAYHSVRGNTNHTNILAYPVLFPQWEDKMNTFPYYEIMTFVVGIGDYIAGITALSFEGLFIIITMHGVAHLRVLKILIEYVTKPGTPKDLRITYLRQSIDYFENIYKFCEDINTLYMHLGLLQFLMSLVILGIVMFEIALGLKSDFTVFLRMMIYLSAALFQVSLYCITGQLITNESDGIPNVWYGSIWYDESKEFQRLILMMILRTNRLIHMRASWFSTMTLSTLLAIVKTSSSYFLLLRNLAFS